MKRIFALALTFSLVLLLSGCNLKEDPLEKFIKKMETEQNFEMEATMDVPLFGKLKIVIQQDGNKSYTSASLFSDESFTEEVEGIVYEYSKNSQGEWVKSVQETEDVDSDLPAVEELKYEDFTKGEDGKYTLNQEKASSYEVDSLIIELTEDGAIMTMEVSESGFVMSVIITISKIGEVTITLPEIGSTD